MVLSLPHGWISVVLILEDGKNLSICLWLPVKETTNWILDHTDTDSGLVKRMDLGKSTSYRASRKATEFQTEITLEIYLA